MRLKIYRFHQVLALVLTIVALMAGQSAWAESRTVTYKIQGEIYIQNSQTALRLTFVPTSGTGFGYSTGPKTTTISNMQNTSGFSVELDDKLQLQLSLKSGSSLEFVNNIYGGIALNHLSDQNAYINVWSSHYYITHVMLGNHDGNALSGQASPWMTLTSLLEQDVDMVTYEDALGNYRNFNAHITGRQIFAQLTVTYGDPREYAITYTNAVNDEAGVTNTNATTFNVTTPTFQITAPTRTGYNLDGMTYTDAQHPNATTATLPMTISRGDAATRKAIAFTAAWTAHTYNIDYDLNGGSASNPATYNIETETFTLVNPTRTGYTFDGWTSGNSVTPQTTITIPQGSTGDLSFTANWTVNHYTVHFDANGGSGTMSNQSFTYATAQNLTANAFTRTGYDFAGWSTTADGSGTTYTDEQEISNLTAEDGATVTLYAQWTPITVTYIDENGDEQSITYPGFTLLESSTGRSVELGTSEPGAEKWYVAKDNVSITFTGGTPLKLYEVNHLILMDGATLTVEGDNPIRVFGSLTIYGQSLGTGRLEATGSSTAIYVNIGNTEANNGTLTINGGTVNATSTDNNGISAKNAITINGGNVTALGSGWTSSGISLTQGDITINGGTVNATGGKQGNGIYGNSTITINGGNVSATGGYDAIRASTITLGWRNASDRIYASSYYSKAGEVVIKSGQTLTDGTNFYSGKVDCDNLGGKTLQPAFSYVDADGNTQNTTAIPLDNTMTTLAAGTYVVNSDVIYDDHTTVTTTGDVTLILADGCTMSIRGFNDSALSCCGNLTIYGQSAGTGTLRIEGGFYAIPMTIGNNYSQYGGNVEINGYNGIYTPTGNVTFAGGTLNIRDVMNYSIKARVVTISGGQFYVSEISCDELTLGYKQPTDCIYIKGFDKNLNPYIRIAEGQQLCSENDKLEGEFFRKEQIQDLWWVGVTDNYSIPANAHDGNYWTTFYCDAVGYEIAEEENACAYTATVSGSTLTLHKLGKVIPSGTAVIIIGEDNSISLKQKPDADWFDGNNDLRGENIRTAMNLLGSYTFYVMGKQNDNFGFFEYTADYMPARKAYLRVSGAGARELTMEFDEDDADGIDSLTPTLSKGEGAIYNLAGQRVSQKALTQRGSGEGARIYIINGKKVLK